MMEGEVADMATAADMQDMQDMPGMPDPNVFAEHEMDDANMALALTPAQEAELYKLYLNWITLKQMCSDRGYEVTEEEKNMPYEEWRSLYQGVERLNLSFHVRKSAEAGNEPLMVIFSADDKVPSSFIKDLYHKMEEENCTRAILVIPNSIAAQALKHVRMLKDQPKPFIIETFFSRELALNITRHLYVPRHEILTPEEKRQLLQRYKIKERNLPLIQEDDPIARYYGVSPGQVLRITRPSETAGRYVSYRLVSKIV